MSVQPEISAPNDAGNNSSKYTDTPISSNKYTETRISFSSTAKAFRKGIKYFIMKFAVRCTKHYLFWSLVGICCLIEPIICSFRPTGMIFTMQIVILFLSSILLIVQIIGLIGGAVTTIKRRQSLDDSSRSEHDTDIVENNLKINGKRGLGIVQLLIFFKTENNGVYLLELSCLLIGWLCIFTNPGLATLRCFRIIRILWFYQLLGFKKRMLSIFGPWLGDDYVKKLFRVG